VVRFAEGKKCRWCAALRDAELGRVLQADPFVQEPTNSQSYNRYSYVFNNPLSFTDPSGFITLRQVIGIVVAIVVGYFLGPLGTNLWKAFWVGFASGFVGGIIITGNFKSALKSGLIAGAIAGIRFAVGNGGASVAEPDAPIAGGAKDTVQSTSLIEALPDVTDSVINAPSTSAPAQSATGAATDAVEQAQGAGAASGVGETIEGFGGIDKQIELALQRGNNNIFSSGLESIYESPAIQASSFLNKQQYFLDKDVLFTSLITNSVSSLAAISWSVEFAVDSPIKNNRILAEEIRKTATSYSNNVRGYEQLQRQIMYGMASVATLPVNGGGQGLFHLGRGGVLIVRNLSTYSKVAFYELKFNRLLQESVLDGIGNIIGNPTLASQLAGLNRSQIIQILQKVKQTEKIKRALDLLNNIR